MNGHLKNFSHSTKIAAACLVIISISACSSNTPPGNAFANVDFSQGSSKYNVYVPSQGRSIMSGLSF